MNTRPDDAMPWEALKGPSEPNESRRDETSASAAMPRSEQIATEPAPQERTPVADRPLPVISGEDRSALPDYAIYERTEPIKTTRFHIVQKGESLSLIARQYYGSATAWRKIVMANSKTIKDPNKIAPGTKLVIPD